MSERPPETPQRSFRDARGNPVPYVGAAPVTWRVGAYVLVERARRVLMIDAPQSGRWELPGGGVVVHETLLEGAVRECFEETGYRVTTVSAEPIHVAEAFFSFGHGDATTYWHFVTVVFRGAVGETPDPVWTPDPLEVRAVRWMAPADLSPENTQPHQWGAFRRAGLL